jgi:hypothetical protein
MNNDIEEALQIASDVTRIPKEELEKLIHTELEGGVLPRFMRLANIPFAKELINEITEELKEELKQPRKDFQKRVNDSFRTILYNLVKCSLSREGLSLPGKNKAYNKGSPYSKVFLTKNAVDVCIKALDKYIITQTGNTYTHKVNSYQPNQLFQLKIIPLIYSIYEEYTDNTELIIIQDKKNKEFINIFYSKNDLFKDKHIMGRTSSIGLERTYQDDLEQLIKINDALKDATYALKAPVQRIYSRGSVMMGGRLYTPLANLPDRKARIRINTIFNGNPVAEVDLKSNHPSMLYASKDKQLPRDFYQLIADESGQSRANVKWLIMKMIGANNKRISVFTKVNKKDYKNSKWKMSQEDKRAIQKTTQKLFPELYEDFYKGMGVVLQSMEGDILLDAMCDLVDKGIVSLPIHDALYVEQQHIEDAEKALKKSWKKNLGVSFEPFVDVDTP